jgi:hypothetical protein
MLGISEQITRADPRYVYTRADPRYVYTRADFDTCIRFYKNIFLPKKENYKNQYTWLALNFIKYLAGAPKQYTRADLQCMPHKGRPKTWGPRADPQCMHTGRPTTWGPRADPRYEYTRADSRYQNIHGSTHGSKTYTGRPKTWGTRADPRREGHGPTHDVRDTGRLWYMYTQGPIVMCINFYKNIIFAQERKLNYKIFFLSKKKINYKTLPLSYLAGALEANLDTDWPTTWGTRADSR